jgi:hypothetical protein
MHFYFLPKISFKAINRFRKIRKLSNQRISDFVKFVIRTFVSIRNSYPTEKFVTRIVSYNIRLVQSADYAFLFQQFRLCS